MLILSSEFWDDYRQDPKEKTSGDKVHALDRHAKGGEGKQNSGNNKANKNQQGGSLPKRLLCTVAWSRSRNTL
jgi:hypothetical protein